MVLNLRFWKIQNIFALTGFSKSIYFSTEYTWDLFGFFLDAVAILLRLRRVREAACPPPKGIVARLSLSSESSLLNSGSLLDSLSDPLSEKTSLTSELASFLF